jgi:hypothetical protein
MFCWISNCQKEMSEHVNVRSQFKDTVIAAFLQKYTYTFVWIFNNKLASVVLSDVPHQDVQVKAM